jgi:hypothetical protein
MDPEHALDSRLQPSAWETGLDVIVDTSSRLKMASQWTEFLIRLHLYLVEKRAEWKEFGGSPGATASDNRGGLKDYSALFERDHKNIGTVSNNKWTNASHDRGDSRLKLQYDPETDERIEDSSSVLYKSEGTSVQTPGFTVVNPWVKRQSDEEKSASGTFTLPPINQSIHHTAQIHSPPLAAPFRHMVRRVTNPSKRQQTWMQQDLPPTTRSHNHTLQYHKQVRPCTRNSNCKLLLPDTVDTGHNYQDHKGQRT